jgi:flagellar hook-basal body complex protein FliE
VLTSMNAATAIPQAVPSATGAVNASLASGKQGAAPVPFADLITDAVEQVNQLQAQANAAISGLMTGTGVDVHTAMIATEKANMAFELALAVHNKAVQAYQSVMGMQF